MFPKYLIHHKVSISIKQGADNTLTEQDYRDRANKTSTTSLYLCSPYCCCATVGIWCNSYCKDGHFAEDLKTEVAPVKMTLSLLVEEVLLVFTKLENAAL